ncbi:hypothetical protein [Nitrobacter winogradskyi]|uniref:ElaB/YqjD/DUF883 family membrane-anchored ribosome-binding protein n=2 Tax=Nitrobacter winogradskyi TaxID=913 RepID=A0ACC6AK00_NITWI|nr:hypothetical protein [Nitrobacter winogradskyi]MCP1999867.1 ElaB/YqjD/DUF883 family membrane-anchored ribosome-binding protein [Nitrobacter winogradskyi]GEC17663.1 hypothetical protein NWI01_35550 [Nitrobacter winogradskyi]
MSNFDTTTPNTLDRNQADGSTQNLKEEVSRAGGELKHRAGETLRASTDCASDKIEEAANAAKDVVSETAKHLGSRAHEQQEAGADFIGRFADDIRKAARAFENDVPFAARGIESAADYVHEASEKIQNGSFRDLLDGAGDFARRQPAAFLGLSALAGFAAVRFLRASGEQRAPSSSPSSQRHE